MDTKYPILDVPQDSIEDIEQMGSKNKFWFRLDDERWLFKEPRISSGEHWAEKISAELGALLAIKVARVELAIFDGLRGSASLSFAPKNSNLILIHGNEILPGTVTGYDKSKRFRQKEHTIPNIRSAIDEMFKEQPGREQAFQSLAGYLLLDGLIGNTDRHHENWGVILELMPAAKFHLTVAPSFDHASSLGRELTDERKIRHLKEGTVKDYVEGGRGGIYLTPGDSKGQNPLQLAIQASKERPELFAGWLDRIKKLTIPNTTSIIERIPDGWMTTPSKEFALAALIHAKERLGGL